MTIFIHWTDRDVQYINHLLHTVDPNLLKQL